MTRHLRIETQAHARIVTVCRAAKKNALAAQTVEELTDAIEAASGDEAVRGVVLAAEGDVFMAGGDLAEFQTILDDPRGPDHVIEMGERIACIERCAVPVVAAVAGDVFGGGCELLMLCDAVFVERQAGLSFRHARMGLAPAWGGASRLLERVGPLEAARLIYTAERVNAEQAARIGLVTGVVDQGGALAEARSLIATIANNPREVVAANKRAMVAARSVGREAQAKIEGEAFRSLWGKPAHRAAMAPAPAPSKRRAP